ncbi:MAG: TetR/AcrR family transcriptional regulator [Gammaproteobacteria bacterium]|nr:TetR/AcrR family transcriptional regulator [Gammaproteobacteria bacterium]
MGRPRKVSDQAITEAALEVILQDSVADLTLERVATVVGVTAPALVQRFGSRRRLLVSVLEQLADGIRLEPAERGQRQLDTLERNLLALAEPMANPRAAGNFLAFITHTLAVGESRDHVSKLMQRLRYSMTRALQEAIDDGELRPATRCAELASLTQGVFWASLLEWGSSQTLDRTLAQNLAQNLHSLWAPYRAAE